MVPELDDYEAVSVYNEEKKGPRLEYDTLRFERERRRRGLT